MSYPTTSFRTSAADKKQHGVERVIDVSWPLPHWLIKAAKMLSADAYVHWNTKAAKREPNYGIQEGTPITVVICGDGEISVRYYDDRKRDIWCTESQVIELDDALQRVRPVA
jgi:hypothetical protein